MGYKMGVVGLAIPFIFYIVLAFIMESVGMEKIIPLEFIIKKKKPDFQSIFEWTEYDTHFNLWKVENLITFLKKNYFEFSSKEIKLENGTKKTVRNLKKFWDKMLCPFWFDSLNLKYLENENYSFAFFKVLCCEPSISAGDYATVIDPQSWEERYEVQWWEAFSKSFIIGIAISKEAQLKGKQYTWYLFHMTKGQNSMTQAAGKLFKKIFKDLGYTTTYETPSESQDVGYIADRIKKLVMIKKISGNPNWWWNTNEYEAELTVKSKSFFGDAINLITSLVRNNKWERQCLEIMDSFYDDEDVKLKAITVEWGREKRYSISKEWDPTDEQIVANLSKEIAYTEDFFTLNTFADFCLDYVDSN